MKFHIYNKNNHTYCYKILSEKSWKIKKHTPTTLYPLLLLGFISVYSAFWSFWGHFWPLQRGLIFYGWLLKWTQFRETEGVKWDIFFVVAVIFFLSFFLLNEQNWISECSMFCSAVKNKSFVAFLQLNRKMDFGQAKVLSIYFYIKVN